MKVLLINGSPHEAGCTYTALQEVAARLHAHGVETELFQLGKKPMAGCIDCRKCEQTGRCAFGDAVNGILENISSFDGMVVGSPVYYGGPAGQLTAFLDRLFYAGGSVFAGKLGAAVVSCRRGGATAASERMNQYFLMNNMPVVPSQYWNQVHGFTPEEVRQDAEGMQTMRTLADNMAWLLACIEAGRRAGAGLPAYEERVMTNFIR